MVCSCNHCCRGNSKILSLCTTVDPHVALNNMQVLNVATYAQHLVFLVLLSRYKIHSIDVKNINVQVFIQNSRNFRPILTKFGFRPKSFVGVQDIKFYENPSSGSCAVTCRQSDGRRGTMKVTGASRVL